MLDTPCSEVQCKTTGYPHLSHVSPSLPLPCVTVCHQVSTELYICLLWPISFSPTTWEFYFVLLRCWNLWEIACASLFILSVSCTGFGVRFLSKESFITSKLSLCVLSLTPLRSLKALLIFVTQKLNFRFLLFIVVDFLLECGEKLKKKREISVWTNTVSVLIEGVFCTTKFDEIWEGEVGWGVGGGV